MFGLESTVVSLPAARAAEGRIPVSAATRRSEPATPGAPICPHRVARWAWSEGLQAGDAVALLVQDFGQAEAMRLGLSRIGLRVTCLDDRRGGALAESLSRSGATLVIADTALADAYAAVLGQLATYPTVWWNGPGADFASLDLALAELA